MRLLRLQDGKLSLIKFDKQIPPYAILSHTWGAAEDEVTFEDVSRNEARNKKGYDKIKFCAEQAAIHSLEFFWVDTCCINKTDVQEFQNAINLMYRWYQIANMCFVYMADFGTKRTCQIHQEFAWKVRFRQSRWFTRSWTLQELLAPREIKFYSNDDQFIGDKKSLVQELETITKIPASILLGADSAPFSLEECILWARDRESTYEEDQAYSLLGLCGVSMAPNYGEGAEEAFERLRERCYKKLNKEGATLKYAVGAKNNWNCDSHGHEAREVISKQSLYHKNQHLNRETAGLGIGIASLSGVFSTCLSIIERFDLYRDFGVDSRAIISQFDADVLLFRNWGKAVGFDGSGQLKIDHHENLNDSETLKAVKDVLNSINEIAGGLDGQELTGSKRSHNESHVSQLERYRDPKSRRTKILWTLRHKARFEASYELFGRLVGSLRELVPPETGRSADLATEQALRTKISSANGSSSQSAREHDKGPRNYEIQRIFLEIDKQIRRNVKKELDAWLCAEFTDTTYSESIYKRLPNTCNWIMTRDAFCDWKSHSFAPNFAKALWVNGPAGYGKTVLSARIVEHLKAKADTILAVFFFSADLKDREDPFIVARSWLSQIISQNPEAYELASERFDLCNGSTASSMEIMDLLDEIVHKIQSCTFVVDGLDECSSKGTWNATHSSKLESFIRMTIQAISGTTSRILVTSREDQEIRSGLSEISASTPSFKLLEYKITPDDVRPDAIKLSQSIVNRKLENKSQKLKSEIADRIVHRCDSMFLRIKLLENDLRAGKNQKQLERIVDQTPSELSNLYDRNWARLMERQNDRARTLGILRWVAFGLRPLTVLEMTEALLLTDLEKIDDLESELPDEIDEHFVRTEILELCASLVETRSADSTEDLASRTLHFTHFTVRQYVLLHLPVPANQMTANMNLAMSNEAVQNNILAEVCLRYLSISQLGLHLRRRSLQDYAVEFWNKHIRRQGSNYATVSKLIMDFFCNKKRGWEDWRRHYDSTMVDTRMMSFNGEVASACALFYASLLGVEEVVEELLGREGVTVDSADESGRTGLLAAVHTRQHDLLRYFLRKNADVNKASNEGRTPIYVASSHGDIDAVRDLLKAGANLAIANKNGWTPLKSASSNGHLEVVKLLLEKGADPSIADKDGWTPLHLASSKGHLEVVKILLNKGADMSISTKAGQTPIHAAAFGGYSDIIQLLLHHSANMYVFDIFERPPLFYAIRAGDPTSFSNLQCQEFLEPDFRDVYGSNAVSVAIRCGHEEMIRDLISERSLMVADRFGRTAVWWAHKQGYMHMVEHIAAHPGPAGPLDLPTGSPAKFAAEGGYCDVCLASWGEIYYTCKICCAGDFVLCLDCFDIGARCLVPTHILTLSDK